MKMSKRKFFKIFTTALAIGGLFIIIGTAGTADYTAEIHAELSVLALVKQALFGALCMLPAIVISIWEACE